MVNFFFLHFATTTHCNFKFWKLDPPYCTLLYTVPYKYTIYADLHFKFCFNKKKERKKKELCTVHMFNVIYNTNIRNLPEKMQKQVESLIRNSEEVSFVKDMQDAQM